MCPASRKRNLDGQPVVTDSVYFIRNPACSNYGNTQGAPAPKKIDHLLQVRSSGSLHAPHSPHPSMLCTCEAASPGPFLGASVLHLSLGLCSL